MSAAAGFRAAASALAGGHHGPRVAVPDDADVQTRLLLSSGRGR